MPPLVMLLTTWMVRNIDGVLFTCITKTLADAPLIVIANPEEAERALRAKTQVIALLALCENHAHWVCQEREALKDWAPADDGSRHDSSPDLSPPRRQARHDSSPDLSPPRRQARHDSSPDLSPPRRQARHDSSPDLSPPRRRPQASSPDLSPPRQRPQASSPDLSPPHKPPSMADGRKGGIVTATELVKEVKQKKADEAARFAALGDDVTGRGAKTVRVFPVIVLIRSTLYT